jgi:hypothetical protein
MDTDWTSPRASPRPSSVAEGQSPFSPDGRLSGRMSRDRADSIVSVPSGMPDRAVLRSMFDEYDLNKSGALNAHEILQLFEKHTGEKVPWSKIMECIETHDLNDSGDLTFPEFVAAFGTENTDGTIGLGAIVRDSYSTQLKALREKARRNKYGIVRRLAD